jgi:hypothetical protein
VAACTPGLAQIQPAVCSLTAPPWVMDAWLYEAPNPNPNPNPAWVMEAGYMKQHHAQIKVEVAQVLQGERYIPQYDEEKVALAGKFSRFDGELAKAKRALTEEENKGEEADYVALKALRQDVEYWERAVPAAVDTYYWQKAKKQDAKEVFGMISIPDPWVSALVSCASQGRRGRLGPLTLNLIGGEKRCRMGALALQKKCGGG